jgi:hypothetical protein
MTNCYLVGLSPLDRIVCVIAILPKMIKLMILVEINMAKITKKFNNYRKFDRKFPNFLLNLLISNRFSIGFYKILNIEFENWILLSYQNFLTFFIDINFVIYSKF